jgi:hypothetical protein
LGNIHFSFKIWDKYAYTDDFRDHCQHEIRVEKIDKLIQVTITYPVYCGKREPCPPDCGNFFATKNPFLTNLSGFKETLWCGNILEGNFTQQTAQF